MKKIILINLSLFISIATFAAIEEFDPNRCGIDFPKSPSGTEHLTQVPAPFKDSKSRYWEPVLCAPSKPSHKSLQQIEYIFGKSINIMNNVGQPDYYYNIISNSGSSLLFRNTTKGSGPRGQLLEPGQCGFINKPFVADSSGVPSMGYNIVERTVYISSRRKMDSDGKFVNQVTLSSLNDAIFERLAGKSSLADNLMTVFMVHTQGAGPGAFTYMYQPFCVLKRGQAIAVPGLLLAP